MSEASKERASNGRKKSKKSSLTRLEDFENGITGARLRLWDKDNQQLSAPTSVEIYEDETVPQHKSLLTLKVLGETGLHKVVARVDDSDIYVFPVRVPEPHLYYKVLGSSAINAKSLSETIQTVE